MATLAVRFVLASLAAGSLVLFSTASAKADHLASAQLFADNTVDIPHVQDNPDTNEWGFGSFINWNNFTGRTSGSSLFIYSLMHSDPTVTSSIINSWWGATMPNAVFLYYGIVEGNHFTRIWDINQVVPGDVIAISYSQGPNYSGHVAMVEHAPVAIADINPIIPGMTQYAIDVVDSTSSAHGCQDLRFVPTSPGNPCGPGTTDGGAGRGTMRFWAMSAGMPGAGTITGYAWSLTSNSSYYPQGGERPHAIGRYFK